jgi:hypothetical protein
MRIYRAIANFEAYSRRQPAAQQIVCAGDPSWRIDATFEPLSPITNAGGN